LIIEFVVVIQVNGESEAEGVKAAVAACVEQLPGVVTATVERRGVGGHVDTKERRRRTDGGTLLH
jgi:hypothetical protein